MAMPFVSRPPLSMNETPLSSQRSAADGVPEPTGDRTVPVITPAELMLFARLHTMPSSVWKSGTGSSSSSRFTQRAAR